MMFVTPNVNPWLVCPIPQPQARVRLIYFPYAGASAQILKLSELSIQISSLFRKYIFPFFHSLNRLEDYFQFINSF